jgi:thiol-disulfide isomerase/thioredoxin
MKNERIIVENAGAPGKKSLRKRILEWLGILGASAVVLFFFAPESWWQFGVAPIEQRKTTRGDFTLPRFEGEKAWSFADARGKVVLINYWATWCPPCRWETPGLVRFANEYGERGVEVVGVTMDENLELVGPFVENYGIKYPILLPGHDPHLTPDGMALPTTFLYDKNGRLAKKYTGMVLESTLRSDVDALLAE